MIPDSSDSRPAEPFRRFGTEKTPCPLRLFLLRCLRSLPEKLAGHAEALSGERPVAARAAKRLLDVGVRELLESPASLDRRAENRFHPAERSGRQNRSRHDRRVGGQGGLLHDVKNVAE